ncbi:MAG: DUF4339 domain-containing protein [Verrucomicrobiota bacterium]|jgi:hypothetical protein
MANYFVIGGDQKQYGPISAEDLRKWIAEGRLNAQSLVKADSDAEFRALGGFPEFVDTLANAAAPTVPSLGQLAEDGHRAAALERVKGPALALAITAGLGAVYYALIGVYTLVTGGALFHQQMPPNLPPQLQTFFEMMQGPLAGIINLLFAALNGFVLFSALKMMRLKGHTVAVIGSVAAMLPCQCCCVFGLPFGIWALVVLNKPEVKSHFS